MGRARVGGSGGSARRNRLLGTARAWVRTSNILLMSVTLDVSRLSGWLNADAYCRVTRRHVEGDTSGKRREDAWGRCDGARRAHGGTDWALGAARARVLRTLNMPYMVMTLDVSKLSGWLNADARYRVARRHVGATRAAGWCEDAQGRCGGASSVHGGTGWALWARRAGAGAPKTFDSCS